MVPEEFEIYKPAGYKIGSGKQDRRTEKKEIVASRKDADTIKETNNLIYSETF